MAVPKRAITVVRVPRGRRRHALGVDGRAECGLEAPDGWVPVGAGPRLVTCAECRAAGPS